jgi:hypothetical protein
MAAGRLWYCIASIAAFLAFFAVAHAEEGDNDKKGMSATQQRLLTDFLILAVKPEGDDRDYRMVEVGEAKVDAGLLGVVVNALPFDFFGLDKREVDVGAERAQCRAACAGRAVCRSVVYEPPSKGRPVGVCRLQTYAQENFGVMAPVVEPGDERAAAASTSTTRPQRIPYSISRTQFPQRPVPPIEAEAEIETAPPPPKRPEHPREHIPPPPRLPPVTVEYFPIPPRAIAETPAPPPVETAPPRRQPIAETPPVESPPPVLEQPLADVPPAPAPVASGPPASILIPQPPPAVTVQGAEPPAGRQRGLPLWLAVAAIVAVVGGATFYWRNHRVRTLGRLTTRLISDGLDRQAVQVVGSEHRGLDLRFVVSASAAVGAPGTHIELIPKGAAA